MNSHPNNLSRVALTLSLMLALAVSPAHCAGKYSLAKNLLERNKFKESLAESERLLKANPGDEKAHILHVEALHSLRRLKEAHEEINQVIAKNPSSSDAFASRASIYLAVDKPRLVARDIEQALMLNPKNAEAYNCLGLLRFHFQNDKVGAIQAFSESIRLKPNFVPAIRHRGITRFQLRQLLAAKEDLDRAIKLDPTYSDSFNTRGRVLHAVGQYQKAIEDFDRAIKLDPKYDSPYTNKGLALVKLGRPQDAIEWYTKAIELNPGAQNYCNRGTAYFRMGKVKEAERDIKRSIAINPKYANAHNNLGALYNKTGRAEMGQKEIDFAVSLEPGEAGSRRNRGQMLLEEGHMEEAMLDLQGTAAVKRRSGNLSKGDFQSVVTDCTKMIRLHPNNQEFYYDRGFAYFCMGDWPSALADFEMFRTTSATTRQAATNAAILSNFALRRQRLEREAKVPINQVLKRTSGSDRKYWAYRFAEYLSGREPFETLETIRLNNTSKTELKCYYAIDRIIAGDIATAKVHLNWIKEFGDRGTDEYELAMTELARLVKPASGKKPEVKATPGSKPKTGRQR